MDWIYKNLCGKNYLNSFKVKAYQNYVEIIIKITQEEKSLPYNYRGNVRDKPPYEIIMSSELIDGHYLLNYVTYDSYFGLGDKFFFGTAHTAEEADRRLYTGLLHLIAISNKDFNNNRNLEFIDETSHAKKDTVYDKVISIAMGLSGLK